MQKKRVTELMEFKLDTGLDRVLTSIVNYLRFLLNTEQKKSDFRPEEAGAEVPLMNYTSVSSNFHVFFCRDFCDSIPMHFFKLL